MNNVEENKTIIKNFVNDILIRGNMEKISEYFDGDNYKQHNLLIKDGLSGLGQSLQELAEQGIIMKFEKIHHIMAEDDKVLVVSEGQFGEQHTSFYDIFRVSNGKIIEHWDNMETIAPKEQWQHENGKFNF